MNPFTSTHFNLEPLAEGVCACIHRPGGGAYSNAGIIDLGDRTLLVDALETQAAARDLRRAAEDLFGRPVDTIVLTHAHNDHWIGAPAFDESTGFLSTAKIRQACKRGGAALVKDFADVEGWQEYMRELQSKLEAETDDGVRVGLERTVQRVGYMMAEMDGYRPRCPDQTFKGEKEFAGPARTVVVRSFGRGHSAEDVAVLLPAERIAFLGDIGFFDCQPFLGDCDLDLYRAQMRAFLDSEYQVLVPGHGPVGKAPDDIALQLRYVDAMEELIGAVVQRGGSFQDAMRIEPPAPFDRWLAGGMGRFEVNVRYLFKRLGGEIPKGK